MKKAVGLGGVAVLILGTSTPLASAQLPPIPIPELPELPGLPDPIPDPEPEPTAPGQDEPKQGAKETPPSGTEPAADPADPSEFSGDGAGDGAGVWRQQRGLEPHELPTFDYVRIPGAYSTDGLMMAAARLRALGWTGKMVAARVFPPFIVAGRANWVDSWGAARYGPGLIVRRHEGQDVFCDYGDPVLAVERGIVDYDEGGLGGIVARLHRPEGGYWYYAHLSDTNADGFPDGAPVRQGDVLGYCGNSGNAITTPPHVHFGWYRSSGLAANPMAALVGWLERAERHAALAVAKASGRRIGRLSSLISARRFGDGLIPGLERAALGTAVLPGALGSFAVNTSAKESAD